MRRISIATIRGLLSAALVGMLVGCAGTANRSSHQVGGATPPPPAHVQSAAGVLQADYILYPAYRVYHSPRQRHVVFLEGNSWVTRDKPSGVSTAVLLASPSVSSGSQDDAPVF